MKTEKLGTEPAFGYSAHTDLDDKPGYGRRHNTHTEQTGMSKRFYAACAAMQGILSGELKKLRSEESGDNAYPMSLRYGFNKKKLIKNAYEIADELLNQENQ